VEARSIFEVDVSSTVDDLGVLVEDFGDWVVAKSSKEEGWDLHDHIKSNGLYDATLNSMLEAKNDHVCQLAKDCSSLLNRS